MLGFLAMWAVMCAAMMAPTAARPMMRIADGRAVRGAMFMAGYLLVWTAVAIPAYPVVELLPWSPALVFAAWVLVGLYQALPSTARLLRSCRGLRPSSPPLRSGLRYAVACAAACTPLMAVAMATLHAFGAPTAVSFAAMAALAGSVMWGKSARVPIAFVRMSGAAVIAVAALAFVVGVPSGVGGHDHEHGHAHEHGLLSSAN